MSQLQTVGEYLQGPVEQICSLVEPMHESPGAGILRICYLTHNVVVYVGCRGVLLGGLTRQWHCKVAAT